MSASVAKSKKCRTCGAVLALSEFYKLKRGKLGRFPDCKRCKVEAKRKPKAPKDKAASTTTGNGKSAAQLDQRAVVGRITEEEFSEIFAAFIARAKRGDASAQSWIINQWSRMQEASGAALVEEAVNPIQVRQALVACMREFRTQPDYHDRGRRLIEAIIEAGPDKALAVVGQQDVAK